MHVDLTPLYGPLNEIVGLILAGLAAWAVTWLKAYLSKHSALVDKQTEQAIGAALDNSLQKGVAFAMNKLSDEEKTHSIINVNNAVAQKAAQYAIDHTPDAVATFGLTLEKLADMALARLPAVK